MTLKDILKDLENDPEFGSEIKASNKMRAEAAARLAKRDATILKKKESTLRDLYETFFYGIATEELFKQCAAMNTKQLWDCVQPLTEEIEIEFKDGRKETFPP
jgi:hypothetical protein